MRKVTDKICRAFTIRQKASSGNTTTDGNRLTLHGNIIAEWRDAEDASGANVLWITNAGWPSVTTRERLNGLAGVRVSQSKGRQFLNGKEWDGTWTRIGTFVENTVADKLHMDEMERKYCSVAA